MLMSAFARAGEQESLLPFFGQLPNGFGRKRLYLIGGAVATVFAFVYFAVLATMMLGYSWGSPLMSHDLILRHV